MLTMTEEVMTLREVAQYLKITERTLYRLVQEGKVPAFRVGNAWRFRRSDLDRWIAQQTLDSGSSDGGKNA